jgi:hypothetical protein
MQRQRQITLDVHRGSRFEKTTLQSDWAASWKCPTAPTRGRGTVRSHSGMCAYTHDRVDLTPTTYGIFHSLLWKHLQPTIAHEDAWQRRGHPPPQPWLFDFNNIRFCDYFRGVLLYTILPHCRKPLLYCIAECSWIEAAIFETITSQLPCAACV